MATFIVGHGVIEASGPETLVPEGRTITFYTDVGLQFWQVYGMAALQMNDATSGFKTYQSGEKVPNYFMSKYSDNERTRFATVADEAANAIYVGDGIPSNIRLCEATDDAMCGGGRHICGGVFGRIDDDIIYLSCRSVEGVADPGQDTYGGTGQTTTLDHYDAKAREYLALGEGAGAALAQLEDARTPDSQELLAYMMTYPDLRKAVYKFRTQQYLNAADAQSFAAMYNSEQPEEQSWILEVDGAQDMLNAAGMQNLFNENP